MKRLKTPLVYAALTLLAYVFVTRLGGCLAHADPGLTPVPADDYSLIARHGFWGGLLLTFGIASRLLQRPGVSHWIAQRRWLAIVAGGIAVIAAGLNWRLNGGDPEAVTLALSTAIGLALSPNVTSSVGSA